MTIKKGFLGRENVFKPHNLVTGIILWITVSYIFYAFFYHFREAFRILSNGLGGRVLLVLDTQENFIYNLFYASIASAIGYMFSMRFVLSEVVFGQPVRTKMFIRRTLNDQGFFAWSFLLWFGKLTGLLGVWYLTISMQFELDFLEEFPFLLILLPIVTFHSTWPSLRRLVGRNTLQWNIISFVFFVAMSVAFAFKNLIDFERVNQNLRKNSIDYIYDLKVPRSQSQQVIERRSIVVDVYVAKDSTGRSLIFFKDKNCQVELQGIKRQLNTERDKLAELERFQLIANLHVDEGVPMSFVNELKYEFRKAYLQKIQYSTGEFYSKYPSNYPAFKYSGIQQVLHPKYYPEFEVFLDSAESLDLSRYRIRAPESQMYRTSSLNAHNRIEIYVDDQKTTLNGKIISEEKLQQYVYKFIKKYFSNFVVIFNTDDDVSFGSYIKHLDLIYSQIDELRNEMSMELYKQPFDHRYKSEEYYNIKSKYPRNILEWSSEEKRLKELMKKADIEKLLKVREN